MARMLAMWAKAKPLNTTKTGISSGGMDNIARHKVNITFTVYYIYILNLLAWFASNIKRKEKKYTNM